MCTRQHQKFANCDNNMKSAATDNNPWQQNCATCKGWDLCHSNNQLQVFVFHIQFSFYNIFFSVWILILTINDGWFWWKLMRNKQRNLRKGGLDMTGFKRRLKFVNVQMCTQTQPYYYVVSVQMVILSFVWFSDLLQQVVCGLWV